MTGQHEWKILYLCRKKANYIPQKIDDIKFLVQCHTRIDDILERDIDFKPDFILAINEHYALSGGDLIFEIKRKWDHTPVILVTNDCSTKLIKEIYDAGGFGFIHEKNLKEDLYSIVLKYRMYQEEKQENSSLIKNLANLTAHLQEKNAIFKTVMDLITHDTKNLFFYISSITNQIKDKNLKLILDSAVHELNDCILEAYGYLREKKRIISGVEMMNNLRLTSQRKPMSEIPRISFTHDSQLLLYIEVSSIFKNAISNIIENALKFSGKDSGIEISLFKKEDKIIFEITDHGPGISEKDKVKIFERYFRLERDVELDGSGRGLWITKNIIEKECGLVTVQDTSGGGVTFHIEIPAFKVSNYKKQEKHLTEWFNLPPVTIRQKAATIRTFLELKGFTNEKDLESIIFVNLLQLLRDEAKEKSQKHFYKKLMELKKLNPGGRSVLIVDDSFHVHYYLASNLTEIGYRVVGFARNGSEGVSFYEAIKPDLVTLDSTMPIMSGEDAAKKIVDADPDARILFVTGVGNHPKFIKKIYNLLPKKNFRIISKPFRTEKLKEVIDSLLH